MIWAYPEIICLQGFKRGVNNKGADLTALMHRLVCTFVGCMQQSGFLTLKPIMMFLLLFLGAK